MLAVDRKRGEWYRFQSKIKIKGGGVKREMRPNANK